MSNFLVHCYGENWKSPTRSFRRSGKAKRTSQAERKERFIALTLPDVYCLYIYKIVGLCFNIWRNI